MKSSPVYRKTAHIFRLLQEIDILKSAFSLVPLPSQISLNIRRASLLKSSLFSARIEGNPLELADISHTTITRPISVKKREVANIVRALNFIYKESSPKMTPDFLQKLHRLVFSDISPDAGQFRSEVSAIFNTAGVAIYMPPPPSKITELLNAWCQWCNTNREPGPVKAALAHFWFEKIHPFLDGNGRVGRLVISWIFKNTTYDFGRLVTFEEYLDEHRQMYYDELNTQNRDVTTFVEFFLECLKSSAERTFTQIKYPSAQLQSNLLPRRQEIVDIIHDHQMVSFDMLSRRFTKVPKSTLHNDLKQLIKGGHIKKLGATRGVVYTQNYPTTA